MNETSNSTVEETLVVHQFSTTTEKEAIGERLEEASSIVVPLLVFVGILVLSAFVFTMTRSRRVKHVVHNFGVRRPYSRSSLLDPLSDDFETDDPTECLLKGKLQIDNGYQPSYQATTGLHV